jgi:hypothetical protein
MAYVRKPTTYNVIFEEPHPLAGLTIKTKAMSAREFAAFGLRLAEAAEVEKAGTDAEKLRQLGTLMDSLEKVREMFAEKLISWDMEEENGEPTPATLEGVMLLDDKQFYGIVEEWLTAVGGVDDKTGKDSGSGEISRELSELMDPLSQNQAS